MKKLLPILLLVLALAPLPALAAERISSYRTDLSVNAVSVLQVRETIVYDFGDEQKHGIFREIPRQSEDGPRIIIEDVAVTMDGNEVPVLVDSSGGQTNIRIGDPDRTISGSHKYVITYTVYNEIRYFNDRDELYWNAIPQNFPVPIDSAEATIAFPPGAQLAGDPYCYTGPESSTQRDCEFSSMTDEEVRVVSRRPLGANEGMTVAAAIAPGAITRQEPRTEDTEDTIEAPLGMAVGILVTLGILGASIFITASIFVYRLRLPKKRKDGGTIIVQYNAPKGITPMDAGYLATNGTDKNIITATVVQLAIEGWLKLEFTTTKRWIFTSRDIIFHRQREGRPEDLFAGRMLDIFAPTMTPSKLSDITAGVKKQEIKLHDHIKTIREDLVSRGLLRKKGPFGVFAVPTDAGREAMEHLAGLKIYLTMAEKRRLEFHNAPEHNPQTFEKLLPYAIALGVDEPWRKAFADVLTMPPEWTSGTGDFTGAMAGMSLLSSGVDSLVGAYSSGTGSGGGGSSGGGGGGGGGGSW